MTLDMQFFDLSHIDGPRGACHEIGSLGRFGESDAVANIVQPRIKHNQAVKSERNAAVGRSAVLSALSRKPNFSCASSGVSPKRAKILDWITGS